MVNISKSIKQLRTVNGYTQEQVADICGVSRQAVAKWECGANFPDIENLIQLAQLFNISIDEFLTGSKFPKNRSSVAVQIKDIAQNEKIVNQALQKAMAYKEPDDVIFQFISYIGSKIGCDRMYIFEPNPDGSYRNSYEWCAKGVELQIEYLQNVPLEDLSLWLKTFSRGRYIFIEDVDAIADSEPEVYRWLKPQGIQSLLVYPLFGGRSFIGVDNPAPAFVSQTSSLLEIMVHFIESMLQRRDLDRELKQAVLKNAQFSKLNRGVNYEVNVVTGKIQVDQNQANASGYSIEAKTISELEDFALSHPEFCDHLMLDGIQKAIESKENQSIEFISFRKDRTVRWNRLLVSPFLNHKGKVLQLYGLLQDVSEEHKIVGQYNNYVSRLSGGLYVYNLSRPARMDYASDELCAFLGYSRDEFEQVTSGKYTNIILEEDRALFSEHVHRLAERPGFESCEYRLWKKDGSVVEVVDVMESVIDSSGIMYGYAYVLGKSEMYTMLEMAKNNEKEQLTIINRHNEILESLGKDYLNVFRVWLDEDKAQVVKLDGYVTKGMNKENSGYIPYYHFCKQYIQDRVCPEDKNKMLIAMHPDTVRKAFLENEEYVVVYRAIENDEEHFYQLTYVRLNDPENNDRINFVAGFKNVDKIIEGERRQKEELQKRLNVINAILQEFVCAYYYSYHGDSFNELTNSNGILTKLNGKSGNFSENRKRMSVLFPDKEAFNCIDEFVNPETLEARFNGRKFISSQVFINGVGWYEMYMFAVDYDSNGKLAHYIFAAKNINEEKGD